MTNDPTIRDQSNYSRKGALSLCESLMLIMNKHDHQHMRASTDVLKSATAALEKAVGTDVGKKVNK